MDCQFDKYFDKAGLNETLSIDLIKDEERKIGIEFPKQYLEFMVSSNGYEGTVGNNSYLVIWPIEKVTSLNEAYAVNEFAPGLLLFGSDGGDTAYAFDKRSEKLPIVKIPFIGMDLQEVELIDNTFLGFLEYLNK